MRVGLVCLFIFCALGSGCGAEPDAAELRVAVAANFLPAAESLAQIFESETGIALRLSAGSSGALFAQIVHGAPYEVFLSADASRPQELMRRELAPVAMARTYARGRLALLVRGEDKPELADLDSGAVRHVAIANEDHAPYGHAARQVLEHAGIWPSLQARIVRGESVGQALQFFRSGAADAAIVALSLVPPDSEFTILDSSDHDPLDQVAIALGSEPASSARAFMKFLLRSDVQRRLREFGYE